MAKAKDLHPNRTPERNLPYPIGTDAVNATPTFSEEEMVILDGHSHTDMYTRLALLQTEFARVEKDLNDLLNTPVAVIRTHRATKDDKTDLLKLPEDFDTDPSISMAVTRSTSQRFFVCNVYSSKPDRDDLQIIRMRKVFRKVKD